LDASQWRSLSCNSALLTAAAAAAAATGSNNRSRRVLNVMQSCYQLFLSLLLVSLGAAALI